MMYKKQYGYGLPAYRGVTMQRGYGLGGMFKGFFRALSPKLKEGLKTVGKRALKTGLDVAGDVIKGENFKSSLKRRSKETVSDIFSPAKIQKASNTKADRISQQSVKGNRRTRAKKRTKRQTLGVL